MNWTVETKGLAESKGVPMQVWERFYDVLEKGTLDEALEAALDQFRSEFRCEVSA